MYLTHTRLFPSFESLCSHKREPIGPIGWCYLFLPHTIPTLKATASHEEGEVISQMWCYLQVDSLKENK